MKLRQKIFNLRAVDGEFNLKSEEGELILVVNGYTTKVKFEDLCVGNTKRLKNAVKAHSILQTHKLEDGFLVDGADNKYSLHFNGKNILFEELTEAVISPYDVKLSEEEEIKYLDVLVSGIKDAQGQQKEEQVESVKEALTTTEVPEVSSEIEAKEVELEEIIEELADQGYDHFGKGQYNVFLQHNRKPILYVGKENTEYIGTDYNEGDKAWITFKLNEEEISIGVEENALIFPASTKVDSDKPAPSSESAVNDTIETIELENGETVLVGDEGESGGSSDS